MAPAFQLVLVQIVEIHALQGSVNDLLVFGVEHVGLALQRFDELSVLLFPRSLNSSASVTPTPWYRANTRLSPQQRPLQHLICLLARAVKLGAPLDHPLKKIMQAYSRNADSIFQDVDPLLV